MTRTLLVLAAILSGCTTTTTNPPGDWSRLASVPDATGFAGSFAGVSNGALLVAGGSNFPDKKPWEGGTKAWYDTVFALLNPHGPWRVAGHLPRPLGYGVSVTHAGALLCIGGSDGARHHAEAVRLTWENGQLLTTNLPPLPKPLANACGALVDDTLYIAGGQDAPDGPTTSRNVYRLNLASPNPRWQKLEPLPGPGGRMLAVAASFDGAFWVVGGVDLAPGPDGRPVRRYLSDAYRYDEGARPWRRIADLPHPLAAAPSPAPTDATGFILLGGDDGSQVTSPPQQHRGFDPTLLRYDARANRWTPIGALPDAAAARVTTPCVRWTDSWVVPGGEVRPGVRSTDVWRWTPSSTARD